MKPLEFFMEEELMRKLFSLLLVFPLSASAQQGTDMPHLNIQEIDSQNMPNMMKKVQQMSLCMNKINPAELKRVETIARKQDAEVQKLCAAGKRNHAKKRGKEIGEMMLKDPTVIKINKCQEFIVGKIATSPEMIDDGIHICDQLVNSEQY